MSSTRRHPMAHADAAWLHMDRPTNRMVVNSVLWFDRPIDWARAQAIFRERLMARFPRFTQRVTGGRLGGTPMWEDYDDFDPELHFHRLALPEPGDRTVLQEVVGDLISAPLDPDRPLWDAYLLEGYGSGCAVLCRMHHAIADGIALARVMFSLTDTEAAPGDAPAFRAPDEPSRLGPLAPLGKVAAAEAAVLRAGIGLARHPREAANVARSATAVARALAKVTFSPPDPETALKQELHVPQRVAWAPAVPLDAIKELGHATGTTVNDVLVSAVAGAVGEHLREGGEDVDELRAMVPFNLRPLSEPLPRDLGNRFGLVLLTLPVGIEDPLERLAAVHERMEEIKSSPEGPVSFGILDVLGRTPVGIEEQFIDFFSSKATMVLTNVPGPRETVSFAGAPVKGVLVWAPCSGSIGMTVSIFSYQGRVTTGFLVDAGLVADPQPLADRFRRQVTALRRRVPVN